MKSIMISIQPQWVEKILNGEKTIEIRKTMPKSELPVKVYIYCTNNKKYTVAPFRFVEGWRYKKYDNTTSYANGCTANIGEDINGKIVAEFTLKNISYWQPYWTPEVMHICDISEKSCVSTEDLMQYCDNKIIYAWHIDDLKIYDKPKELSEFRKRNKCHYTNYEDGCCFECCTFYDLGDCNGRYSKIERPPQSWCYVEELGERK